MKTGASKRKKGFLVLTLTVTMILLIFQAAIPFWGAAKDEYYTVSYEAEYTKARYLAQSGLEMALKLLKSIPTNILYDYGIMSGYPIGPIPLIGEAAFTFQIEEAGGKINLNYLVNSFDDSANSKILGALNGLSEKLNIPPDKWEAVIDWIDENNDKSPGGYEKDDYLMMQPARRIKNGKMHSIDELLLISGFDQRIIYEDLRTEQEKEFYSDSFFTEEEKEAVTDEDYKLINNITVDMPVNPSLSGGWSKINVNSAPYHVLLSLSSYMTSDAAKEIIMKRNEKRFKNINELSALPSLKINTSGALTLFHEIKDLLTTKDILYKIVVKASLESQVAQVVGYYDPQAKKLSTYFE
ncbi:MAG: general secretion pathway protein GspK [Spirochaetia bacterium]|nr:general secretion pathway protein GspK [Spirochaetia bacterium]